jgi:alkylation response protein AidB-like acyl-CoA dehydrogenase
VTSPHPNPAHPAAKRPVLVPPIVRESTELSALRGAVRAFLDDELRRGRFVPTVDSWGTAWDPAFSARLAARGWIGMTIPREYGGRGATFMERFVVTEELLAAGAPIAAHWVADRQIAPSLLRFGTEEQKQALLPGIAAGEIHFAIGMSEPDSGSDLASVRTKAVKADGGWRVTGSKVWTTGAHAAHYFIVLARTAALDTEHRHDGLSQLVVDLRAPGVEIRPIVSLDGRHHFNEVFLDDVLVPDAMAFGQIGDGWHQVTSELGYERSGPERFMSTVPLLDELGRGARVADDLDPELGRLAARTAALHHLSISIAAALSRGEDADVSAAIVKVLGTTTEGDVADHAGALLGEQQDGALRAAAEQGLLQRPGFTIRGGTNEILRGVIARGLGLR